MILNRIIFLSLICISSFSLLFAQDTLKTASEDANGTDYTTIWTSPWKVIKNVGTMNYAGAQKNRAYVFAPTKGGKAKTDVYDMDDMSKLSNVQTTSIPPGRDMHELFQYRRKLYLITSSFDKKKKKRQLYMQEINWDNLQLEGKEKRLASVKTEDYKEEIKILKYISPDKEKIAFSIFSAKIPDRKTTTVKIFVLDKNLRNVWSKRARLKFPSLEMHLENFVLNSAGDCFALVCTDGNWEINEKVDIDYAVVAFTHNGDSIQTYKA